MEPCGTPRPDSTSLTVEESDGEEDSITASGPFQQVLPREEVRRLFGLQKEVLKEKLNLQRQRKKGAEQKKPTQRLNIAPEDLVGKRISHRFKVGRKHVWYSGTVLAIEGKGDSPLTTRFQVVYDEDINSSSDDSEQEEDPWVFTLMEDYAEGDLKILDLKSLKHPHTSKDGIESRRLGSKEDVFLLTIKGTQNADGSRFESCRVPDLVSLDDFPHFTKWVPYNKTRLVTEECSLCDLKVVSSNTGGRVIPAT
ncbi:hypothetical protein Bbelb_343340 [Branchiostoma belcheri]|nr:hypothetical protein Bbelb_343340 [Branchiostoma belcheri]